MILIFGGAFQGKLDYARKHWNFNEDDIFYCDDSLAIDLSKKVIYGLDRAGYSVLRAWVRLILP